MEANIRMWLTNWFVRRAPDIILAEDDNFFARDAIDSFGVIELIEDVEDHFGISFIERDYQDRRFPTIAGLAEIIAGKESNGTRSL